MTISCRSWWRNCALHTDSEIMAIDRMEDHIAPIGANVLKTRELISSLELCHHKAERWVYNIIEAIGAGQTTKGGGTHPLGQQHPGIIVWRNTCAALSAWCAGCPSTKLDLSIETIPASQLLACLGVRSPLKEWQVQRVVDKIRSVIHWSRSDNEPAAAYVGMLLSASEHEAAYLNQCPEYYKEHEDFWLTTVRTSIHDTENGGQADLSLAIAIDLLFPCHWKFLENLQIVLEAIGGRLNPDKPFAACGRNITLIPIRQRMETISKTLKVFCGTPESDLEVDRDLLVRLGKPTEEKKWLAASLGKTIKLQLNPPAELRAMSAMAGPEWIKP